MGAVDQKGSLARERGGVRRLRRGAFLAGTVACATARANAAEPAPIRFIGSVADALRPFLYANDAGLFRAAGLAVTWTKGTTGALVAQQVIGGAQDIGQASITSIIAAYARGLPFALIAPSLGNRLGEPTAGICTAAGSPIRTVLDLQNKTVSCSAVGDIAYLGLRSLIDRAGGDSSTVKFTELPPTTLVTAAITQGRIDAGLIAEPAMMEDVRAGSLRFLVDELTGYSHPILEVVYFSTVDYAAKNRATAAKFARAISRANAYCNAHVSQTASLLVSYGGMDPQQAQTMRHGFMPTAFDAAAIQPVIDLMAKYKLIPQGFDAHNLLTTRIVEE